MSAWLFVPGNDRRKLQKALGSRADVVVVDWEDGVPDEERATAREVSAHLLRSGSSCRAIIRINAAGGSEREADLAAVRAIIEGGVPVDGLMLPKVDAEEHLAAPGALGLPLVATIESAAGLERLSSLARSHPALERFALGSLDLLAEFGLRWRADQPLLEQARARLAIASLAAGLQPPLDGIFPPIDDLEGLAKDSAHARELGFTGKLVIHPGQVPLVQNAFAPNEEEMELARRTLEAHRKALDSGSGVANLDGEMIDAPSVAWAKRTLGLD
ncbi:MAG TPA: CoA ester lyase [Trueperaceae bacterium]